jgi:hypothetical protein
MRVGSLQSATLQSPQLAAWPGPVPDHCPLDRRRVLKARRSEAADGASSCSFWPSLAL